MDASTRGAGVTWPPRGYGITVMSTRHGGMLKKLAAAPLPTSASPCWLLRPGSAGLRRHRTRERRKPLHNMKAPLQSLPNARTELI
jgi:hypothetical protein